ncbi:uncharacterized protein LOC133379316 isoform X3 [Rhineura floridana]|uniref:uncharacterized protein LOC133379316 isoform X3 n=1 Tax=Rhineura floridana TaxID=261503 RepID=UPI002AC7F1AD|nr:uncharacterized protein LOC133379316 isoform X3 [Rhineura floridana]
MRARQMLYHCVTALNAGQEGGGRQTAINSLWQPIQFQHLPELSATKATGDLRESQHHSPGVAVMKVLALTLLCLLIAVNEARVFEKCELARTLKQKGMDGYRGISLANWICTAYYESRFNTAAVGPPNSDGSRDYGIFQINSRWWCDNGRRPTANGCKSSCSAFLRDDITNSIECAKRIVRDPQGMNAWRVQWCCLPQVMPVALSALDSAFTQQFLCTVRVPRAVANTASTITALAVTAESRLLNICRHTTDDIYVFMIEQTKKEEELEHWALRRFLDRTRDLRTTEGMFLPVQLRSLGVPNTTCGREPCP